MIIKQIKAAGVKVFSGTPLEVEFNPNLNVVYGLNRSGKSSLIDAIVVGLFGFLRGSKDRLTRDHIKSWERSDDFCVDLYVDINGDKYRYYRDFTEKSEIVKKFTKSKWVTEADGNKEIDKFNKEILGVEDSDFFLSTACLRQRDIDRISGSLKSVGNIIQGMFSGSGEVDIERLIKELEAGRKEIKLSGRDDKRADRRQYTLLGENLTELKEKLDSAEINSEEIDKKAGELKKIKSELPVIEKEYNENKQLLEKVTSARKIHKDLDALKEKAKDISKRVDRIKELTKDITDLKENLKGYDQLTDFEEEFGNLDRLDESRQNIEEDIRIFKVNVARREEELNEKRNDIKKLNYSFFRLSAVSSFLSFVIFTIIALTTDQNWMFIMSGCSLIMFFGILSVFLNKRSRFNKTQIEIQFLQQELARYREESDPETNKKTQELSSIENKINSILESLKIENLDELKDMIKSYSRQKEQLKIKESVLREQLDDKDHEEWNEIRLEIQNDIGVLERRLEIEGLDEFEYDEKKINKWQINQSVLDGKIEFMKKDLKELEVELNFLQRDFMLPEEIEEEIKVVEEQIDHFDMVYDSYSIAIDMLNEVRVEVETEYKPELEKRSKKNFLKLTGSDFESLSLNITGKEGICLSTTIFEKIKEDTLSLGTQEQLYFALRLSALEILEKSKYPLIIDDSFTNYDDISEIKVLDIIKTVSEDRQVLFLTCHKRFFDWAKDISKELKKNLSLFELSKEHIIKKVDQ
ncbi:AAA family ATPase [candidate division KSB1 bacterium]